MNEEIRYLGDVQRLVLKPGDRVVLMVPCAVSDAMNAKLKSYLELELEGHKVLVLSDGIKIGVLGAEPE